ncbi:MAG TPA: vWA domain-containing protein, partial [Thermoanaerobaculia bacterium]
MKVKSALLLTCALVSADVHAADRATADAIVIVDTSISMREAGMDPERASLLVTKLLADIVPGDLAVVRLLDLHYDRDLLPSRETGVMVPCSDDPTQMCQRVDEAVSWEGEARTKKLGLLARPARGDAAFKQALDQHLEQRINNSMFHLAFRAAQGTYDDRKKDAARPAGVPRTVIWLSDGRSDSPDVARQTIRELVADGVTVEAIVFGRGDTKLASAAGLTPQSVSTPGEIMKAFAGAFRRIVRAPYEIDNLVSVQPAFDMKAHVDEAWIVVYGDDSLGDVSIDGPQGTIAANHGADRWPGAGAYRVAYMERPPAGRWTVRANGGGSGVAYAVVQRSSLGPVLVEPKRVFSGATVRLVGGISAGGTATLLGDPEVLRDVTMTAEVQGQTITLLDGGAPPDTKAGDGRFSANAVFRGSGRVPVRLRIESPLVDRTVEAMVDVSGSFRYLGSPVEVDLGSLRGGAEVCRALTFEAAHEGEVPFALKEVKRTPSGHELSVRLPAGIVTPGGDAVTAKKGDRFEVCLTTTKRAPSSVASGERWLELHVAGSSAADHRVPVQLRWSVHGLTFWERWGWLILLILGILILLFLIGG